MAGTRPEGRLRPLAMTDKTSEMERGTTMTTEQTGMLVLKNATGDYVVLPQQVLEKGRVPAGRRAEVEQAIVAAQGGDGENDVQGHAYGVAAVFTVLFVADVIQNGKNMLEILEEARNRS